MRKPKTTKKPSGLPSVTPQRSAQFTAVDSGALLEQLQAAAPVHEVQRQSVLRRKVSEADFEAERTRLLLELLPDAHLEGMLTSNPKLFTPSWLTAYRKGRNELDKITAGMADGKSVYDAS
jgi:hypothetical protein